MNTLDREDFDEYIHEMCSWPIEKIVDTVADDLDLRDYLAACAGNYRNGSDFDEWNARPENQRKDKDFDFYHFWDTTKFLVEWTWKDYVKFSEEADRKSIAHWAPYILRALDQRMRSAHSQQVKKELEQKKKDLEEKKRKEMSDRFFGSIPAEFKGASIDDWKEEGPKKLINLLLNGWSFIIWGGRGIGKTRLLYAVLTKIIEDGKDGAKYIAASFFARLQTNASSARCSVYDIIDDYYTKSVPVLFLDECDKLSTETQRELLGYLVDTRYENHLQTVLICNSSDEQELEAKLTSSVISRFKSKSWHAKTLHLQGSDKRGTIDSQEGINAD